ncbi:phosphoglycerate mutase-like protein [Lojkania enalia]|uniref:Phosphoglycerate mutase-like protein n=1 Tax=Lojkania enalia TaxID=147567 RepID=A0A9P4KAG1_9PLEO|nr:phosphoglycerate mutase-like protein [Didymosphaeria enalia]
MAPNRLHLIRHAQGHHNLSIESHNIKDPTLTDEGEQQCHRLSETINDILAIDCIVASPLRRTLWTAIITFQSVLKARPDMKIIALPELQETSSLPCDTGKSLRELKGEFAELPIDWTCVHNDWNNKHSGRYAPRADLVAQRALKARRFLQSRKEKEVAAVTHGGFLHFLTEDWRGHDMFCGTGWANCEIRTYEFDMSNPKAVVNAIITETASSVNNRSHNLQPLTIDEQLELQAVAEQSWAKDGYITPRMKEALLTAASERSKEERSIVVAQGTRPSLVDAENDTSEGSRTHKRFRAHL